MSELLFVNRNCVVCIIYYHRIEDGRNAMKSLLLSQNFIILHHLDSTLFCFFRNVSLVPLSVSLCLLISVDPRPLLPSLYEGISNCERRERINIEKFHEKFHGFK